LKSELDLTGNLKLVLSTFSWRLYVRGRLCLVGEFVTKREKAGLGGFTCCFVLNDIPVLGETSILQANDVHHSLREDDFRQAGRSVPGNALSAW
jgi:hypothetical protein